MHAAPGQGLRVRREHAAKKAFLPPGLAALSLSPVQDLGEGSFSKPGLTLCNQVSHGIKRIGCVGPFAGNFSLFPYFLPAHGGVEQLLSLTPRRFQAKVWRARGSGFSGGSTHPILTPIPGFP